MSNRLPVTLRAAPITRAASRRCSLVACLLSSILLFSGCAKLPPSQSGNTALSGKRLAVKIQFRGPINPNFHYFFLINYDTSQGTKLGVGDQNAPGPIPVLAPTIVGQSGYGNGFATGSSGNLTTGFTDFVRFEGNSYRLFHVVGNVSQPSLNNFVDEGQPVTFVLPNSQNPHVLQFEIDLSQLVVQSTGASLGDPTTTVNTALAIRYLQMNIVATDVVPVNQTAFINKQVDSLGDNRTAAGSSSFLSLDMSQLRSYTNQDAVGKDVFEPGDVDVYGAVNTDPALDIVDYTITVVRQ